MKVAVLLAGAVAALILPGICCAADPVLFTLTYKGTCYQTDASGKIVGKQVTEKTLLEDFANAGGITDLKTLAVVYHVGGSDLGDTIDVVNATNGQPLGTLFGLFFGEAFGRTAITNGTANVVK